MTAHDEFLTMLPARNSNDENLFNSLPPSIALDVPYFKQEQKHTSGAAVYRMLLAANEIEPPSEADILEKMGWGDWKLFDHETYKEDLLRAAPDHNLFPVSYYPGHYVLPKFKTGIDGADFLARNREFANEVEGFKYMKALLVKSRKPLYIRKHFDIPEYNMPEEMAEVLDTCGHGIVVIGYNEHGFIVHDPWNKEEWGGYGGGENRLLTYKAFGNDPSVNCCYGFVGQMLAPEIIISYPKYALIPEREIEVEVEVSMPGIRSICIDSYSMTIETIVEKCGKHRLGDDFRLGFDKILLRAGDTETIRIPVITADKTGSFPLEFEIGCRIEIPAFSWESRFKNSESRAINFTSRRRLDIKSPDWINKYGRT